VDTVWPGDFNGDGKTDVLSYYSGYFTTFLSNGDGTYTKLRTAQPSSDWAVGTVWPGDFNGDGKTDVLSYYNSNFIFMPQTCGCRDILTKVALGVGITTTFSYKPLTYSAIYTKDSGTSAALYPIQDLQSPMYVVSSVSTSDGLGANVVTTYTYGGAKADLNGRGFLGFRWTRAVSPDTNLDLTTTYRQDYPYIGLPSETVKKASTGEVLSTVANTYANTVLTTGSAISQFPYVSQTQEQNYELDGSLVTSTTTSYQYDDYGNATEVTVNSNDGFIKTTANLYANDVPNWLLGRLLRSSVTTTAP